MTKEIIKKTAILIDSIIGEGIKQYNKAFARKPATGINTTARSERVTVSLTSYGRRVASVLPVTVLSLMRQTYKPDTVVLWLDRDHWNSDNTPDSLKRLQEAGLTIKYCEDLKSYKKYVTAIEEYPDDLIITTDDDFYYSADFVERLMQAHAASPDEIHTHRAHRPTFNDDGSLKLYNDWGLLVYDTNESPLFATTGGGCLFKRSQLYKDITDRNLFSALCPMADDVWFYFMSVLNGTRINVLPHKKHTMIPLDNFYQLTHKNASLSAVNCGESYNDVQIRNVMKHYGLTTADLMLR